MSKVRQIIETYIKNTPSNSVQRNFALWLKEERNEEEKNQILTELWDNLDIEANPSTEKSFQKLQSRIATKTHRANSASVFIRKLFRVAAILILPLLSAIFTYTYLKKDTVSTEEIKFIECIVPNGEIRDLTLPDASQVRLNAGSILVYPEHFGKTRAVYLNGEAYFSVAKHNKQRFIVNTADMAIEVLGTVFNVCSYPDSKSSSITLESGKVNVCFEQTGIQPEILVPNEQISYDRSSKQVKKQTVKTENAIAWTKGNIIIQSMSIDEIVKTIERKYNKCVYLNSHRYSDEKITMKLDNEESITDFMNILQNIIPGLQYKIESDKLYIY
ncbi:MAG TPA: DUF4974 domain-containing protein [Petrimonas sp.]|uniref:FecR family protein n=1 Tax=Petrimonas sp. TaxID=2023866 RepID=UPI00095C0DFB|nr:MAG: hypothetical protein BGO33_10745 [Bacteroidia bacterium 43-41]HHV84296.1 DUF4974 domain-containing protein [Petrimonas sp.]